MITNKKRIAIIIAVIIAITVSNLIGGFIGFGKGYVAREYMNGLDAISTIMVLNSLRNGKIESAIHSLETQLDWQIYNIGSYEQALGSLYNLGQYSQEIRVKEIQESVIAKVGAYRREHPCQPLYDFEKDWCNPDDDFRKQINNTLKKYEGQSKLK